MVHESDIGTQIEYRGRSLGVFPRGMTHVLMKLIDVKGDAAFLSSTSGDNIFGVNAEDCYPSWYIETQHG